MRARIAIAAALTAGLGLLGAATATASPMSTDPTAPTMPGMSMDMPGMNMPSPGTQAKAKPPASLSAAMQRSQQKPIFLQAKLTGANEVPVAGKPAVGDPKGSATGIVEVQGNKVTYAFSWKGISAPTLGHIHEGVAGVNGDVKVPLFGTPMPDTVNAAAGTATITDQATADGLRKNPAGFYLNLHTKEFPGGAVRGQLSPLRSTPDMLKLLQIGGLHALMSGFQEVKAAPGEPKAGDPKANAVAFVRPSGTQVSFSFAWFGFQPTLAHIHKGTFGKNGPVVVPLIGTTVPEGVFAVSGTATGLDRALVSDIARHPLSYYANLHDAAFPGGAARGQLF
ncbi:CHRD domain-containing protein [Amycolatopsis sp. FDAARGOS 1241]|uniref:CHRD domain-containing protein n=1 Tax=Amycolatopsis sp. FDAARGOS 1241 TaxID=2778070 RepID=UPI00194FFBE2|nr:CHRD domain-containing protein [Amycolatopsis sp. FDAARGOS 1241]QRP46135.1 CHRD domain-containing protein [Amycolatopsis sp. FDAARGOS 1241]